MSARAIATFLLIAWGALAFGAPYPWAFIPLFIVAALLGISGLVERSRPVGIVRPLAAALALVACAIAAQLIPLSPGAIAAVSPETHTLLARYAVGYGSGSVHPLSVRPGATSLALTAFAVLSIFLLGSARALTTDDVRRVAGGISVVGVVLAIVGIAQKAMWNGKLYGFWVPDQVGSAFGPFNNHNHFAGWMLMAGPLAAGLLCGQLATRARHVRPGWRNRILWFSSPDASKTILVAFAILVMAAALVVTLSRSGILGLVLAVSVMGWFVVREQSRGSRLGVASVFLILVVLGAVAWTGFGQVVSRFSGPGVASLGGRLGPWADAWHIAQRFPLTGTGVDSYGVDTLFYQTAEPWLHFSAAHNDYLQLLAEGGILVCLPVALAVVVFARSVRERFRETSRGSADYWMRAGAVAGILAIGLQEAAEFSLQMPGNAVLFALLCAIAIRPPGRSRGTI